MIAAEDTIDILVIGACENYGDHMPFGANFIFPTEFLKRISAAKLKNIIILPHIPYDQILHHDEYHMTMNIQPNTDRTNPRYLS
jgi:creatinine amidohydrolase